jgi:hypothetical protein
MASNLSALSLEPSDGRHLPRSRRITLLHRRPGHRETMSDYLIRDLERYRVAIRDRGEIAELHGADGELEAVSQSSGRDLTTSVASFVTP